MEMNRDSVTLQQCTRNWWLSTWRDSCVSGAGLIQSRTAVMTYVILSVSARMRKIVTEKYAIW